jgi:hypothetical protein
MRTCGCDEHGKRPPGVLGKSPDIRLSGRWAAVNERIEQLAGC